MVERNATIAENSRALLHVRDLAKHFPIRSGLLHRTVGCVRAVDGISFDIHQGETFGLVGESGCGKTTAGRAILRLVEPTRGSVAFRDQNVLAATGVTLKRLRRNMQIIFQDPFGSLDPRMPVGEQLAEPLRVHGTKDRREREVKVRDMLELVGLRPQYARRYPHEFSGGQRQRIAIARALILHPDFVVCDEPVSALDVSVQSQVLNLLRELQADLGLTYLFIAHNLAVVKYISDRVAVMYVGKIVELAPSDELYTNALHPYTKALISAIPKPNPSGRNRRTVLAGDVPNPARPPAGCRFHTRCPSPRPVCSQSEPLMREVVGGHFVACHVV
ncbi:MAG: dipeptide ABC transporter ATP-binding protein [Acidobacteria bacterium]|nr:dipeptide ABC transporter ATP-binding protein [Acidobacteriota bacterium]